MKIIKSTFFIVMLSYCSNMHAQMVSMGTEFFVSLEALGFPSFSMVSKEAATVTLHFFHNPDFDTTFTLVPHKITTISYYLDYDHNNAVSDHVPGEIDNKSVQVCADKNIILTFGDMLPVSSDYTAVYPVLQPPLEHELYYLSTTGSDTLYSRRAALIVSHFDSVTIEIVPKLAFAGHAAGIPFQVTLNRGETYSVSHPNLDESGSTIQVVNAPYNHPITVYSSTDPVYIGYPWIWHAEEGIRCCADVTLEQMLPVSMLDTVYHFVPYLIAEGAEEVLGAPVLPGILRIVSVEDNNTVRLDGVTIITLNAGDVFDTLLYEPAVVTSKGKVIATQMVQSSSMTETPEFGDPDLLLLMPLKNGIRESYFEIWEQYEDAPVLATITIVAEADNNDIELNDVNIAGEFIVFPADTRYKYVQKLMVQDVQYHLVSVERIAAYSSTLLNFHGGMNYALSDLSTTVESLQGQEATMYICDTATLSGLPGCPGYLWSNGATTLSIQVSEPGIYWVISDFGCSKVTDTFHIKNITLPELSPSDTILCKGDSMVLSMYQDYFTAYYWSTGETDSAITVSTSGTYTVTASTEFCDGITDTFTITTPAPPVVVLPEDAILCQGQSLTLDAYLEGSFYRWNTGETVCCITVDTSGQYWVSVTDRCNESSSDSCHILFTDCDFCLLVPNAFTPNGDGLNDKFTVLTDCMFGAYRLDIFNRFGQRVFISYNPEDGWDGTYNGQLADVGVYFYRVEATHVIEKAGTFSKQGDLTLIR